MVRLMYSSEKTNSFRPVPWHWSTDKFPAFRGSGARYSVFQAVGNGYVPKFDGKVPSSDGYVCSTDALDNQPSKIVKTQKGTLLVVSCSQEQDEKLMLITLRGGFRGGYSRIEGVNAEILMRRGGNIHCCPTEHMVVRLTNPIGYVFAETGRRCATGLVEIFSWEQGYVTLPTEEFEVWRQADDPFAPAREKADREAQAKAEAEAASKSAKEAGLGTRLEAVNARLVAIGHKAVVTLGEISFKWGWQNMPYTEENVANVERQVTEIEVQKTEQERKRIAREVFLPKFEAFSVRLQAVGLTAEFGEDRVKFVNDYWSGYDYSDEGVSAFAKVLDQKEREAAEARAKATAEAEYQRRKTEAVALGLPTDIRIWRRRCGRTNAGDGWVITPDGQDRPNTGWTDPSSRRLARYGEGEMIWEQVLSGEVVLKWSKSCSAAEHQFEVVYLPTGGLTEPQFERIKEIQDELEKEWEGARGLASGIPSPSVGDGWNLIPKKESIPTTGNSLDSLASKWGARLR